MITKERDLLEKEIQQLKADWKAENEALNVLRSAYRILKEEHNATLQALHKVQAEAFEEAARFVEWKMRALGPTIHPSAKVAYEEAIRTIKTWNMERSSVMDTGAAELIGEK